MCYLTHWMVLSLLKNNKRGGTVAFTGDKGTLKGLTLHPVGINTVLLSHGYLKSEFYAAAPLLTGWSGKKLAQNLLSSMVAYGLTTEILPSCLAGSCFDGEYYLKHVPEHIASELKLTPESKTNFLNRSIWDPDHRLEKAEEHARKSLPSSRSLTLKSTNK